ncbi:TetR/AcrR family transcriptional regulator [Mycolicibacterium grossiae]|uniref:TetR family transcriptional regulator n=1 Tax=Mycolicibacterium grossiae TaxID=1552759 RepID=A0A1E8PWF4_9MYCO|nr:TetR/AcrR family transcriptional regulator [Mycolicibacterium grossiae]OFJ50643.1 TetR family transcriptional regulator [Mycolicibacterium grossiae]QEM44324.1 TetR/AcrR family transcriptional regulator [Mycolicibacterium grossiae]
MGGTISRESYLDTGLDVLSDLGYGGLKLAEVCTRLGVTTGSFYHYFSSWSAFGQELVRHWVTTRTLRVATLVESEPDPRRRIEILVEEALMLPYGAEAAIRVWSSIDPAVHAVQAEVDAQRFDMLFTAGVEVMGHDEQARRFATTAMYLLIGCEQSTLPRVPAHLRWIADRLLIALEERHFAVTADPD